MAVAPPFFAYLEELRALQGEAKVSYPTGDRNYPVTERVRTMFNTDIAALLPSSPEPNAVLYPRNFLVTLEITKADEQQSEVYLKYESTPGYPSGQNAWSYELNYVSQGLQHPIYIRRTTERRTEYQSLLVPRHDATTTPANAFTGITEIRLTAQGKDYKSPPGVEISLGSATAVATAVAHLVAGKVVRIELTSHGWGYTYSADPAELPTVTIAGGGGTGATAVAIMQPASAVLVSEETQPAQGDLAADFIVVTRTWKTLPGPVLTGQKLDQRTGYTLQVIRQEVFAGTQLGALPAGTVNAEIDPVSVVESLKTTTSYLGGEVSADTTPLTWRKIDSDWDDTIQGEIWEVEVEVPIPNPYAVGYPNPEDKDYPNVGDTFMGRFVIDRKTRRLNDNFSLYTLWTVEQPDNWIEYNDQGEQFPALFDFLMEGTYSVASISDFNRPGVVYNYLAHRTDSYTQRIVHGFVNSKFGPPSIKGLQPGYHVLSPAAGSRVFPINANTIHPAFSIADSKGMLEIFPASVPATYSPDEELFRGASCSVWRGRLYHIIMRYSRESGFVDETGPGGDPGDGIRVYTEVWLAKSAAGGIVNLTDKSHLVYDGEPLDRFVVSGTVGGHPEVEDITIGNYGPAPANYGPVHGPAYFSNLQTIHFDSPAPSGVPPFPPRVMTAGSKAEYAFTLLGMPHPGDTWSTKVNLPQYVGADFTYTFADDIGAILLSGTPPATVGGIPLVGPLYFTGTITNGKEHYMGVGTGGGLEMLFDGVMWILRVPGAPTHYFKTVATTSDNPEDLTWTPGVGSTTTGTPDVDRFGKFSDSPGKVRIGSATTGVPGTPMEQTRNALIAAVTLAPHVPNPGEPGPPVVPPYDTGVGYEYGAGTLPNPYFQSASATEDALDDSTLNLVGRVANKHASELDYTGTADGTFSRTKDATTGAMVADTIAGSGESTHYNHSKLTNPWYSKLNVPPALVDAPSEEFVFPTPRRVTIRWRMQPEVTIKYQTWNASLPTPDWNTAIELEQVGGDTEAELPPIVTDRMRFLISNSEPVQARACNLYVYVTI